MAEESSPLSPPSSGTSPLLHKRRITHQNPSLNLSLQLQNSTHELGFSDTQQTQPFPEQSPKKPKCCSLNNLLSADEGSVSDEIPQPSEKLMNLDHVVDDIPKGHSKMEQLGGELLFLGDVNEVSGLGFEQKETIEDLGAANLNLDGENEVSDACVEKKEVIETCSGEKMNVEGKIEVSDMVLEKVDVGVKHKEIIEQLGGEVSDVGFEKKEVIETSGGEKMNLEGKNEVSDMVFEKADVCVKQKEVIEEFGGEVSDVGFEQKEVADEFLGVKDETVELGCDKKDGNCNGVLPKMVKDEYATNSLIIEVVDGTALVDVSLVEDKRNRRRVNNHKRSNSTNTASVSGVSKASKKKCVYSRKELEALRYVNVKGQRKVWQEIYNGFSVTVKKEYDEVGSFKHHKRVNSGSDYHKNGGMKNCNGGMMGTSSFVPNYNNGGVLGESCSENVSCEAETISSQIPEGQNSGEDGDDLVGEWSEDYESDDEYESINRPAFRVEGEPNFESGPPEDGLEYLRRVRWEAKQIPKVKIAKLDNIIHKDQSVYMPEIPDIEKCPPHLVPLRQWEDEFIADFSKLRLDLSCLEDTRGTVSTDSEFVIFARPGHKSQPHCENSTSLELTSGGPILSTVLTMDPVSRVTMLRKRIKLFENASGLSKDNCAWLFALCAVVDTPLDADTCASLRCLLRSCAKLRAAKIEVDDEVIMLNVLATISGKFFGQSGN